MKKLVWAAALVLLLSFLFPNGVPLPAPKPVEPDPVPAPVVPAVQADAAIVKILASADSKDRARIVSVYEGLYTVLSRDGGNRVNNTEKLAEVQANTLQLAIDTPGKYPGLDVAIEDVFRNALLAENVDPTVVNPVRGNVLKGVLNACEIIMASARAQ